jgi:hypothetical protein
MFQCQCLAIQQKVSPVAHEYENQLVWADLDVVPGHGSKHLLQGTLFFLVKWAASHVPFMLMSGCKRKNIMMHIIG